ncbi:MAG: PAS domain S-box protein [Bacteroidales bacterium]|nr:PAS domain S-box protein [Bacteroidales bacterium]
MKKPLTRTELEEEVFRLQKQNNNLQQKYNTLCNTINYGVIILDNHTITDCNPLAAALFNLKIDAILNSSFLKFLPDDPHLSDSVKNQFGQLLKDASTHPESTFLWKLKRADQTLFDAEITVNRITTNQNLLQLLIQDISNSAKNTSARRKEYIHENKKLKSTLKKNELILNYLMDNEQSHNMLFNNAPIVIEIYNSDGFLIMANQKSKKIWGEKEPGTYNIFQSNIRKESGILNHLSKVIHGKSLRVPEVKIISPYKNREIYLQTFLYPLKDRENQINKFVIIEEDISSRKIAVQSVEESNLMLQTILDTIPVSIYWKDVHLNFLGCNKHFLKAANCKSTSEIIGKSDYDLLWKNKADTYRAEDQQIIDSETPLINVEEKRITHDNKTIWVKTSKIPLKNLKRNTIGVVCALEDITKQKDAYFELEKHKNNLQTIINKSTEEINQINKKLSKKNVELVVSNEELISANELLKIEIKQRKKIEKELEEYKIHLENLVENRTVELKENEERIRTLSNNLPDGAIFRAVQEEKGILIIKYISANVSIFTGIPIDKIVNYNLWEFLEFVHPDDKENLIKNAQYSLDNMSLFDDEFRFVHKSGHITWLQMKAIPQINPKHKVVLDGFLIDITSRKQAEHLLHLTHFSIDKNKNPIFWINKSGKLQYINEAASLSLNYPESELMNKYIFDINLNLNRDDWKNEWNILKEVKSRTIESVFQRKDGSIFSVEISEDYLSFEGNEYVFVLVSDITQRKKTQNALINSERNYREIFNATNEAIIVHDAKTGMVVDVNDTMLKMYNCNYHDALTVPIGKLSMGEYPYDLTTSYKHLRETIIHGEQHFEWRSRKLTGELFWTEIYLKHTKISGDDRILAVVRDISEKKKAEKELQASELRYKALFEQAADGILVGNSKGQIIEVNTSICILTGYTKEELLLQPITKLFTPKELQNNPLRFDLLDKGEIVSRERTIRKKDGSYVPAEMYTKKIPDGRYQAFIRDISQRKMTERALQESEERFRSIVHQLSDIVWVVDENLQIKYETPSVSKILGFEADYLVGKNICDFIHDKEKDQFVKDFYEVINKKNKYTPTIFRMQHVKGYWINLEALGNNLLDHPAINGIIITARDITERIKSEQALKESEERLTLALEATTDGLWDWDILNKKYFFSPRYYKILDYKPGEFEYQIDTWKTLIHPDDQPNVLSSIYRQPKKKDENIEVEYRMKTKSGEWKWILSKSKALSCDKTTTSSRIIGTITDITERKYAEQALVESEAKYRILYETAGDAILMMKGDKFVDCNPAALEIFGCKKNEILNKTPYDFSPQYQSDGSLSREKALFLIEKSLKGKHKFFDWQHTRFNKEIFETEVSLNLIELSGEKYLQAIVRDITDRKKAEKELRLSEEKFRNIFNSSTDAIVISDLNFKIKEVNQTFLEKTGYYKDELEKLSILNVIPEINHPIVNARFGKISVNNEVPAFELEIVKKNHEIFPVEISGRLIDYSGKKAIVSIIRDITERKEIEKKVLDAIIYTEEKEREKFARNLHDDLGPLLSSIKMYVNSMEHAHNKQKQQFIINQLNEIVKESIVSTKEISNDLSPHILTNYGLTSALTSFASRIQQNLKINYVSNLNGTRFSNEIETSFYRIIKELINNTIKHARATNIWLELKYKSEELTLLYYDDGIGVNFEKLEKENTESMGISNIISRSKSLKGKYKIVSSVNKGFRFELKVLAKSLE